MQYKTTSFNQSTLSNLLRGLKLTKDKAVVLVLRLLRWSLLEKDAKLAKF